MNILYTIPSLEIGGAEIFLVRLLNHLAEKGHHIFILDFEKHKRDQGLVNMFSEKIQIIDNRYGSPLMNRTIEKIELQLYRHKNSLSNRLYSAFFRKLVKKHNIQLIHSHLYRSDRIVASTVKNLPMVTTLHGCYNAFSQDRADEMHGILNTFQKIIYITDINLEPFQFLRGKENILKKTVKIYNGLNLEHITTSNNQVHKPLRLIVVSRCIKEKGWQILIEAVKRINQKETLVTLNLVGGGDYLSELKRIYSGIEYITFSGQVLGVNKHISEADVCCFPSVYKNESLPNSIMEYMAQGKPVISNNIGEVANMITCSSGACGFIPAKNLSENELITFFEEKIKLYLSKNELAAEHGRIALECVKQFDIKQTAATYLNLYESVIHS